MAMILVKLELEPHPNGFSGPNEQYLNVIVKRKIEWISVDDDPMRERVTQLVEAGSGRSQSGFEMHWMRSP